MSGMLSNGQTVTTLAGTFLTVTINTSGVFIDNAQVTVADVVADNGVVHVIDVVLMPNPGCTDPNATNYDSTANIDDSLCTYAPFSGVIGDTLQGGIVFWLDGNGGGLIAAPSDQGQAEWGCFNINVPGTSTGFGTGAANTIAIVSASCLPSNNAAVICSDLILGGNNDWFLPSRDELQQMYNNIGQGSSLGNIAGLANDYYWTSSQYTFKDAWSPQLAQNCFTCWRAKYDQK